MEKLTLEHIAPFLPYGLKGNLINDEYYEPVYAGELFRIETGLTTKKRDPEPFVIVGDYEDHIQYFTPILRSMDLTKPIKIDGAEIIPIEYLKRSGTNTVCINSWVHEDYDGLMCRCVDNEEHELKYSPRYGFESFYRGESRSLNEKPLLKWLYKHKFDVDGLIGRGLAIDVNTLETNPYD